MLAANNSIHPFNAKAAPKVALPASDSPKEYLIDKFPLSTMSSNSLTIKLKVYSNVDLGVSNSSSDDEVRSKGALRIGKPPTCMNNSE